MHEPRRFVRLIAWLALVLVCLAGRVQAQEASSKLFVRVEPADHGLVRVAIETRISPGWHLYHGPTKADLGDGGGIGTHTTIELAGDGVEWAPVRFPKPKKLLQPMPDNPDGWINGHEGTIVFYGLGRAEEGVEIDAADITAKLVGLTCQDDGVCIPYREELESQGAGADALLTRFPADLTADAIGQEPPEPTAATTEEAPDEAAPAGSIDWNSVQYADYTPVGGTTERGLLLWLVLAFVAGILLNVMPCVLPVVSIKVLSFVQQAGESKGRVLSLGLAFAGGILVVFLGLASLTAFLNKGWGSQFQSEQFKIVMIAVVFAFSLSLFDVFELGVPTTVGQLAGGMRREGLGDAFFKGMMATVLATPCSGPFLGSTMTWALSQNALIVFAVFTAVGLGMAAPYVVLTSNPALLKYVPKPGAWMQTFKHLMGFMLLATVIFLMVSVRQDMLLFTITFLIFVGLASWQWGRYATLGQTLPKRLATGVLTLAIVLLGARFSFVDFRGFFMAPSGAVASGHLEWEDFDPVALQRYHEEGRPVMVDFTAEWCFNCKLNEKVVYESRRIMDLLEKKGVVPMKADMTHGSPKTQAIDRLMRALGGSAIPFMAIFPGEKWQAPHTFYDIVTRGEVAKVLEALPDASTSLVGAR